MDSLFTLATLLPELAYVDPGLSGILFQLGYVLFYGLVGALAFLTKPFGFLRRKKSTEEPDEKKSETKEDEDPAAEDPGPGTSSAEDQASDPEVKS